MQFLKRLLNKALIRLGYVEKKEVEQSLQTIIAVQKFFNEKVQEILKNDELEIKNLKAQVANIENYLTQPRLEETKYEEDESEPGVIKSLFITNPLEGKPETKLEEEKKKLN
jgi:hypothetical protein